MSKFYKEKEVTLPAAKEPLVAGEFRGDSWSVKEVDSRFFLEYISGAIGGRLKTLEISKVDYELACSGELDANTLCLKYGVS